MLSSRSAVPGKPRMSPRLPACVSRSSRLLPEPSGYAFSSAAARSLRRRSSFGSTDQSMLWVALHFPRLPPRSLEPIAAWACQFTPRVTLEPPQAVLAEVQASLRHFGGRERLLEQLRGKLAELGFEATIACASTGRAAIWLARAGCDRLEDVAVEATGFAPDNVAFLRSVGVRSVGELLRLPRDGLARRCGQPLLDELDRALGRIPEAREFFSPPACFDATLELPAEVAHAEALLFAARRLFAQLEGLLAARHAGIRRFRFNGMEIGLASPTRDARRMERLLRERLAASSLARPVGEIRLEASEFTPLGERSAGLFGDAAADEEDWARLLERLRLRLGHDAVCGLALSPDHRPEHASRRVEPGEWDPRAFTQPGPRPLWLLEPRRRLREDAFALLAGPERIECGWWDGDEAKRDYFIARLGASLAWVCREDGEWFLHGFFA